jgi:hypothetical protein
LNDRVLIRVPDSWPQPLVAGIAMIVLAVVDLASAVAAKEAVARRSLPLATLGLALYAVLFWVYSSSLRYADLAPVTLGWIVVLQVGVLLLDRFKYGTTMSRGQWIAVLVLLVAQAYLLLAPAAAARASAPDRAAVARAAEPPGGVIDRPGAVDRPRGEEPSTVPLALVAQRTVIPDGRPRRTAGHRAPGWLGG